MSILLPESPLVPSPTAPVPYPAACPSWCAESTSHDLALMLQVGVVNHFSAEFLLPNPAPLDGLPEQVLRIQLLRTDTRERVGQPKFYLCGESEVEIGAAAAEVFLAQLESFVGAASILRRQMT